MRRRTFAAILTSMILSAGAVCLTSCTAPGAGAKAEAGYANARPVIAALEKYHETHKEYPATLNDLVPLELADSAAKTPDGKPVSEFFEYKKSGPSYQLQFRYSGPGMNRCVYTPEAAKWECAGHY
ncbi:MAG: hypothetical protein ABI823_20410 [Bryobacteraceae bacterium]